MSELLSGREGSTDAVVNVTTVEFRFGAIVLTEKLVFNKTQENFGIAGSHLVSMAMPLVCVYYLPLNEKRLSLRTSSAKWSSVSRFLTSALITKMF